MEGLVWDAFQTLFSSFLADTAVKQANIQDSGLARKVVEQKKSW